MTKISFIVVAYNAAQSLDALLGDLLSQTIAPEQLEALLVDSASTDDTAQIMRCFAARAPFEVKLLKNPKRWLASGINVALRAATGDAVIRLDAHARMPKDFLQKNLDALARGEDIVGGSVCGAPPETAWEAVTRALDTSRFCGGAAPFRNGGEARYVDTLAYALYRREVYDRVGLYDERLRRTEDNDMHYRMRKAGYRFYFSPDIVSWHAARKTLRGQLSQKWGNGYWIGRTMRIQPRCFAPRHLVPALFVLALIVLALLCPLSPLPLAAMLLLYGALDVLYAAINPAIRYKYGCAGSALRKAADLHLSALPVSGRAYRLRNRHALRSADRKGRKPCLSGSTISRNSSFCATRRKRRISSSFPETATPSRPNTPLSYIIQDTRR